MTDPHPEGTTYGSSRRTNGKMVEILETFIKAVVFAAYGMRNTVANEARRMEEYKAGLGMNPSCFLGMILSRR